MVIIIEEFRQGNDDEIVRGFVPGLAKVGYTFYRYIIYLSTYVRGLYTRERVEMEVMN